MSFFSLDWSELSLQVTLTFAHFLWQACVIGIVLLAAQYVGESLRDSQMLRRSVSRGVSLGETDLRAANMRYAFACLAFFSLPICVAATFVWVHQSRGPILLAANESLELPSLPIATVNETIQPSTETDISILPTPQPPAKVELPVFEPTTSPRLEVNDPSPPRPIQAYAPYLLLAYTIGVAFMFARFCLSIASSTRLRRTLQPIADSSVLKIIAEQASRLGLKRVPVVALCQRVSVPIVVGILKPMILLPPTLLCGLDPNQLAAVLSHELAHIRRYDLVVNLLQRLVEAILFFHPITWWISRRVSVERERCCDDVAAACIGRLPYASALLQMAELCLGKHHRRLDALASLSADGGNSGDFGYRIRRLIGSEVTTQVGFTRRSFAIGLALVSAVTVSFVAWGQNRKTSVENSEDGAVQKIFTPEPLWQTKLANEDSASDMWRISPVVVTPNRVLSIEKDFDLRTGQPLPSPFARLPRTYEFEITLDPVFRRKSSDRAFIVEVSIRMPGNTSSELSYDLRVLRASDYSQVGATITPDEIFEANSCDVDVENGGRFLLLGDRSGVHVYRTETGQIETTMPVKTTRVDSVAMSPDREWLVVSDQNNLHFWRWRDQAPVKTIQAGRKIDSLAFTPDGQYLAEGPDTREDIQLRDMRTLEIVASLKDEVGSPLMVSSMDITPDGRYLVAHNEVSVDQSKLTIPHRIHVWDLKTRGKPVFQIATGEWVRSVAFSDDGRMIVGEFSGATHGALIAAWQLPDEVIRRPVDVPNDAKDRLGDGIQWSRWGDQDGLLSGARLKLPEGGLKPGQPLVVEYRLANVSTETKTLKCYLNKGMQFTSLSQGNRIGGFGLDWHREPVTLTIEPGNVFIDTEHLVSIDTSGLEPGEYHVALGSAFHYPNSVEPNTTHEIPHRGSIPFTIVGESPVKIRELPKSDIHWGKPIAGLRVGSRFIGDPNSFTIGATVEADLFVANVTDHPLECSVVLPHPQDGWLFNVEDRSGNTIMLQRPIPFSSPSPQRRVLLTLAPGEVEAITGDQIKASDGSHLPPRAKFEIANTKIDEASWTDYTTKGRLVTQGGQYSAVFDVTLLRPEIPFLRLALDSGNVPFKVVDGNEEPKGKIAENQQPKTPSEPFTQTEAKEAAARSGKLNGRLSVEGTVVELPKLRVPTPTSPRLAKQATDEQRKKYEASLVEIADESLLIDANRGLSNAFVYLAKAPANWQPTQADLQSITLSMRDYQFDPRSVIVRTGQDMRLNNSGTEADNFGFEALKNDSQNRLINAGTEITLKAPFATAERLPIRAKSQMNTWKTSFILPLDHPFAAITDGQGRFFIEGLPPGEHSFHIWHERTGWLEKSLVVNIQAGQTTEVNRSYSADRFIVAAPNVFGDPVAGISIRLHPLAPIKLNSTPPEIKFETKQKGNGDLILSEVDTSENRIEMDGEVYAHPGLPVTEDHQHHFRSVKDTIAWQNAPGPRIVMDGQWKSVKDGKPLTLKSGKHSVRFGWGGFHPLEGKPEQPDKNKPAVVWSNVGELIVSDFAEVAIAFNSGLASYDLDAEKGIGPTASVAAEGQLDAFDLRANFDASGSMLTGYFRKLLKVDEETWSSASGIAIRERLEKQNAAERDRLQQLSREGDKAPSIWLVETSQGTLAILNILYRDEIETELNGIVKGYLVKYRRLSAEPKTQATNAVKPEIIRPDTKVISGKVSKSSTRVEGIVLNSDQQPLANAPIAFLAFEGGANQFNPIYLDTDKDGRFAADVPSRTFRIHIGSPSDRYESIREFNVRDGDVVAPWDGIEAKSTGEKVTVVATLERTYEMRFDVVDEERGGPIRDVAILFKEDEATWYEGEQSDYEGAAWNLFQIIDSGMQTFQAPTPFILGKAHVLITTKGFESVNLKLDEKLVRGQAVVKQVRMKALPPVEFTLRTAADAPAVNATLETLKSKELRAIRNYNGGQQLEQFLTINVMSDAQGMVQFPSPAFIHWTTYRLEHPEGYVNVRGKDLPKAAEGKPTIARKIRLTPYARFKVKYLPQVKENEFLEMYRLNSDRMTVTGPTEPIPFDEHNQFELTNLPAGWYTFVHRVSDARGGTSAIAVYGPYQLTGGERQDLTIGNDGRSVVGQWKIPEAIKENKRQFIVSVSSGKWPSYPQAPRNLESKKTLAWWNAYWLSDEGKEFRDHRRRSFSTVIASDGSFYFPSLPPGKYKLQLDEQQPDGRQSKVFQTAFEIPNDNQMKTVDLGDPFANLTRRPAKARRI